MGCKAHLQQIGRDLGVPMLANMVERGRTPVLTRAGLESLGYKLAIFPVTAMLAAVRAMTAVDRPFQQHGSSVGRTQPLYDFAELTRLIGFEDVRAFEKRLAQTP